MRIAALFDIHGNLPALEAVLADVRRANAEAIVVGGDIAPGPMPRDSLAALLSSELPLHSTSYPLARDFAHDHVLRCPTAEEMLSALAKAEIRA